MQNTPKPPETQEATPSELVEQLFQRLRTWEPSEFEMRMAVATYQMQMEHAQWLEDMGYMPGGPIDDDDEDPE